MLVSLSWLSLITVLASGERLSPVSAVTRPVAVVHPAMAVDTGAAEGPVLLTKDAIVPYAAVEQALAAYWQEHPDRFKAAQAGQTRTLRFSMGRQEMTSGQPDYTVLIPHDTAIATIFTQHHLEPAQFQAIQGAVYPAIAAVISGRVADTTRLAGKNMAFVQAHRQELAPEWTALQGAFDLWEQIKKQAVQSALHRSGGADDLQP